MCVFIYMHKITEAQADALVNYVNKHETTNQEYKSIHEFCKTQPKQTKILYRGHDENTPRIDKRDWFSTTSDKKIAKEEFAGKTCCVFIIHIVDVPMIDVNHFVKDRIEKHKHENEFIVLGGGEFYKDANYSEKGFQKQPDGTYECWYKISEKSKSPKSKSPNTKINRAFEQIDPDEYDMIDSAADIHVTIELSKHEKEKVFQMIQKAKKGSKTRSNSRSKGGKSKTYKNRKNKTRRNR